MQMRVTVCQLQDDPAGLESNWTGLVAHVRAEKSNLVLLPEMPFSPWFAASRTFNPAVWAAAVAAHTAWESRLGDLAPAVVIASRPIDFGNERYNEGFVWDTESGIRSVHAKTFLPDEEGVWEASWYQRATPEFTPVQVFDAQVGFLIGTETLVLRAGAPVWDGRRASPRDAAPHRRLNSGQRAGGRPRGGYRRRSFRLVVESLRQVACLRWSGLGGRAGWRTSRAHQCE
jgi:hypothetical protein